MRTVTLLLLLACTISLAYGDLVCGSDYCKKNPCVASVAEGSCKNPSVYKANHAGKCACCPACVTLLNEGDACKIYSKEIGETPLAICKSPLHCIKGACTTVNKRS